MNDIFNVAYKTRLAVEQWVETANTFDLNRIDLEGACAIASYTIWKALLKLGYKATFCCGCDDCSWHCWVEYDGHVIDITATQFSNNVPKILIVPIQEYEYYDDYPHVRHNSTALRVVNTWGTQAPKVFSKQIKSFLKEMINVL